MIQKLALKLVLFRLRIPYISVVLFRNNTSKIMNKIKDLSLKNITRINISGTRN
jgi:hypothetical protein